LLTAKIDEEREMSGTISITMPTVTQLETHVPLNVPVSLSSLLAVSDIGDDEGVQFFIPVGPGPQPGGFGNLPAGVVIGGTGGLSVYGDADFVWIGSGGTDSVPFGAGTVELTSPNTTVTIPVLVSYDVEVGSTVPGEGFYTENFSMSLTLSDVGVGLVVTPETPNAVAQGQSTLVGIVTPANSDPLTLTEDSGAGTLSLDGDDVEYTAPASVTTSAIDDVSYTVTEDSETATGSAPVQLDAGPTIAVTTPDEIESGQFRVVGIVTPGVAGDTLTLTQPSAVGPLSLGPVQPGGTQQVIYTASAGAQISEIDTVPYTITDQHGDAATQTASVQLDSGPFLRSTTTGEIAEKGQTISIGLVAPGVTGDDLEVAQTAPSTLRGTLSLGKVLPDGTQQVLYTAPETIASSVEDGVGFTVTDQNDDAYASAAVVVKLDAGPTAGNVTATAFLGQTDLTSAILADVTRGLAGDTETITAVGPTSDGGVVTLTNGDLTYNSPADGSTTDSFTYTVTDQLGGQATGTVNLTVVPPSLLTFGPTTAVLDVRAPNDIGRGTGEFVVLGDSDVTPNGNQGTMITATPVTGTPFSVPFVGSPVLPNDFRAKIPYDPSNTSWTLTITNGATKETTTAQLAAGAAPPPFATNVQYTASTETFTWTYPANSINGVYFTIYDDSLINSVGSAEAVYATTLTGTTGTFTVPTTLDGGLTLQSGHKYTVDLQAVVAIDPTQPLNNWNVASESESYFDLDPGTSTPVYLPMVVNGVFNFNMTVVAGQTYNFDPTIATGYRYATGASNPNFASVVLPAIQTSPYRVTFTSGGKQQTVSVAPNTIYTFPTGGVSAFTVAGISAADNLDPTDPTAFVTGLTFVSGGSFTGTQTPLVDLGPTAGAVTASANVGQTVDLTAAILAHVTPGVLGDTETITAVGTASQGVLKLTNGDLTYAPNNNHILANGSVTDSFTYTVTDELNDTATGTVNMTVSNPAVVINGSAQGNANIKGGSQTNIVNAFKLGNTITESGGNDVVNAGAGSSRVVTGSGDVVVSLNGVDNTVVGGNGNDTVNILTGGDNNINLGTGTGTIVEASHSQGSNTFVLTGSHATMTLYGANDVAFIHGGTDTITDNSNGLTVKIGPEGGAVTLNNFLADHNGLVKLVSGVGGYLTGKAAFAALQTDGNGGSMLSLGASGHIDFAGAALGSLTASQFHIG
jgi:hypothetical protein